MHRRFDGAGRKPTKTHKTYLKIMAVEKIALGINLRKNKISTSAGYGKYYPEVDTQKTLSLRGFAQHMVDHGSIYGRAVMRACFFVDACIFIQKQPQNVTNLC